MWHGKVAGVDEASTFFKAERVFPLRKMHEVSEII